MLCQPAREGVVSFDAARLAINPVLLVALLGTLVVQALMDRVPAVRTREGLEFG